MLDERLAESLNDIAKMENLSRARVTQIMDLLKLPAEIKEFLTGLQDPAAIRRYSKDKVRISPDFRRPDISRNIAEIKGRAIADSAF